MLALRRSLAPARRWLSTGVVTAEAHQEFLTKESVLPSGFRVGATTFSFCPPELPTCDLIMTLSLLIPDEPTESFAACFTKNAFCGAPVRIGRELLSQQTLGGVYINNRISNVRASSGVEDALAVCDAVGRSLDIAGGSVLPCSTGIIGWKIPVDDLCRAVPSAVGSLQPSTILPAAKGIMTTDNWAKVRSKSLGDGRIVGIAKGAGMVEPNMATMLVYILTDIVVPRDILRGMLRRVVDTTFNCISIDSDTSTSDTVLAMSSNKVDRGTGPAEMEEFEAGLQVVCNKLAEDVVRNGEGVQHVLRVKVLGAPSEDVARGVGKAVVNSPLFKTAVAGNDPNVGRLVCAIGKSAPAFIHDKVALEKLPDSTSLKLGGIPIYQDGKFVLEDLEQELHNHMVAASMLSADGKQAKHPPHERCVEVDVDLGLGEGTATILGADLTKEYVSVNADYRS